MITVNENRKLEYVSSGLFKSDGIWQHPKRTIDTYEIIFMHEGTAYIAENSVEYVLVKNDVLLLEPMAEHCGFRPSEDYVSFSWLHFRTDNFDCGKLGKHFSAAEPYALKTLFAQCLHTANTPTCSAVSADLYTALIAEEIMRLVGLNDSAQHYLAVQIREFIRLNIEKDLSVCEIAAHFGYCENHISRIFKSSYGIPLKAYIARQRTDLAQSLLHTTTYTVKQISQKMSFKSENHFIKFFKYHTKLTPTEYRSSYCNTHINKA